MDIISLRHRILSTKYENFTSGHANEFYSKPLVISVFRWCVIHFRMKLCCNLSSYVIWLITLIFP